MTLKKRRRDSGRAGMRSHDTLYYKFSLYLLSYHGIFMCFQAFLYVWPRLNADERRKVHRLIRKHMGHFKP